MKKNVAKKPKMSSQSYAKIYQEQIKKGTTLNKKSELKLNSTNNNIKNNQSKIDNNKIKNDSNININIKKYIYNNVK